MTPAAAVLDAGVDARLDAGPGAGLDSGTGLAPAPSPTDSARVAGAMRGFAREITALSAFRLESCIHCGICAESCHYYIATEDPQYTPIWKVEAFKQAYKREASPMAPLVRLLGFKRAVRAEQLEQWQHLLYESCNLCGRCSLICPMGIDITALIEQARSAMFEAGLAPPALYRQAANQLATGQPMPTVEPLREKLEAIGMRFDVPIPIDAPVAEVMLCISRTDIERYPAAVAAIARLMQHLGISCTFRSAALIAENYAYYAGSEDWQRDISRRLIDEAIACGASTLIIPECGHAYTALRWQGADLYGQPLPFEVKDATEFLADQLKAGRLKLRRANSATVTFQDPCQLSRRDGVEAAPRLLMKAMGVELHEMDNHGAFGFCCGGGGGVVDIARSKPLYLRTMETKMREIDAAGGEVLLTGCSDCRYTFDDAKAHFAGAKTPASLLELVAQHLDDHRAATGTPT